MQARPDLRRKPEIPGAIHPVTIKLNGFAEARVDCPGTEHARLPDGPREPLDLGSNHRPAYLRAGPSLSSAPLGSAARGVG